MIIVAALGYRRWLSRPWQWTLGDLMIITAIAAMGLKLSGSPAPTIALVSVSVVLIVGSLGLARHGFKLIDIATVWAIVLLAAGFMLSAMQETRARTLGGRFLPFAVPARFSSLILGPA